MPLIKYRYRHSEGSAPRASSTSSRIHLVLGSNAQVCISVIFGGAVWHSDVRADKQRAAAEFAS